MNIQQNSLLNFLNDNDEYNVQDFYDLIDNIQIGYKDLEASKTNPEEYNKEEIEYLKVDIDDWENKLEEIKTEFLKCNKGANWEEELTIFKKAIINNI